MNETPALTGTTDEMYLAEARAFFARSRAQGGPGVTAEDLAKLLTAAGEINQHTLRSRLESLQKQYDIYVLEANNREIELKQQIAELRARPPEAEQPRLRGRKPRAPKGPLVDPKIGIKPTPENIDAILANTL